MAQAGGDPQPTPRSLGVDPPNQQHRKADVPFRDIVDQPWFSSWRSTVARTPPRQSLNMPLEKRAIRCNP